MLPLAFRAASFAEVPDMRPMPLASALMIGAVLTSSSLQAAPVYTWSHAFGGPGINTVCDVAVDGSGNVVIVGDTGAHHPVFHLRASVRVPATARSAKIPNV